MKPARAIEAKDKQKPREISSIVGDAEPPTTIRVKREYTKSTIVKLRSSRDPDQDPWSEGRWLKQFSSGRTSQSE